MSQIVEPKVYQGKELETIFFRPMLSGANAEQLGIRVLYNMPVPTTLNFWRGATNVLKPYTAGWDGGFSSEKFQKTIDMHKVKSEMGYSAADYFNMVFEEIAGRPGANFEDLGGTELEEAETRLFREALAESLRATMWMGSTARNNGYYDTFDGLLKRMMDDSMIDDSQIESALLTPTEYDSTDAGDTILKKV